MNDIESFQTDNNSIVVEGTVVTVNENATLEDWKVFGEKLKKAETGIQWILGAWWNHGHKKYNRDAEEFIKELGYKKKTLRNYGYIYKSVKVSCRRDTLSFRHHESVAVLSPEKQVFYLNKAEKEGLGSDSLRAVIRKAEKPETKEKQEPQVYTATNKRLAPIKKIIDHLIEMIDQPSKTLIPQSLIHRELLILKEAINKFN